MLLLNDCHHVQGNLEAEQAEARKQEKAERKKKQEQERKQAEEEAAAAKVCSYHLVIVKMAPLDCFGPF